MIPYHPKSPVFKVVTFARLTPLDRKAVTTFEELGICSYGRNRLWPKDREAMRYIPRVTVTDDDTIIVNIAKTIIQ